MSPNSMLCLSRKDPNKKIFSSLKNRKKTRMNFYPFLEFGTYEELICANERYFLLEICLFDKDNPDLITRHQPCTLIGTEESIELNMYVHVPT